MQAIKRLNITESGICRPLLFCLRDKRARALKSGAVRLVLEGRAAPGPPVCFIRARRHLLKKKKKRRVKRKRSEAWYAKRLTAQECLRVIFPTRPGADGNDPGMCERMGGFSPRSTRDAPGKKKQTQKLCAHNSYSANGKRWKRNILRGMFE